jgi:steroid delta-isomerase
MSADLSSALATYARFWETLTPARLDTLADLVAPDVRFKDPFNDVRGAAHMIACMRLMYDHGTPRFEILDRSLGTNAGYLLWRYVNDPGDGKPLMVIDGMSEIRFRADGRVAEHLDHWDAAEQVYERVPLLGALIRLVKRRLQLPPLVTQIFIRR